MKIKAVWILLCLLPLVGCGSLAKATPGPLPTVVLDQSPAPGAGAAPVTGRANGAGTTVSGAVVPAREVQLAFNLGQTVETVAVSVGDQVEAGQVLARLSGSQKQTAAVKAAELEVLTARQALAALTEDAGQARAQAMLRLANAQSAYDEAQKHRGWKEYRVGDDNQIDVARADLIVAEDTLKKTQDAYGGYADSPEDNLNKAAALSALSAARKARDRAQANLNYLLSLPDNLEVAKVDAELEVARSEVEAAQREWERVKSGADPQALALAQARLEKATAQLQASRLDLASLELKAGFAGTVSKVAIHPGEWATPGQPVIALADLEQLQVKTTDLSEMDVPGVAVGQPVTVLVKALNQEVRGRVVAIAPLADTLGGDVVYQTTIALETRPAGLRAGMSVDVRFGG